MDYSEFWKPYVGAVSLTFDDGRSSQLEKAIPMMEEAGVRGTFYLCPRGDDWRQELAPWADVARKGHEIGNHSISHTCTNNLWGGRGGLEDKTLEEVDRDILGAQKRLAELAPHQTRWTFAYPCYNTHIGRGEARRSYVPLVARHFLAGRGAGEFGFGNFPDVVDLACIASTDVQRMSGFEMIGLVEELTAHGQWVVLVFHEIDGPRLTVGSEDFKLLLGCLRRRSQTIWTAPLAQVAAKVADLQSRLA